MDAVSTQVKTTPARRKHGRGDGKSGAQKAYASENDVAILDASRKQRAPQTPNKANSGSPAPTDTNAAQTSSRQRNRNRNNRVKNVPTSPDPAQRSARQSTPPHRSVPMKPGTSAAAFAGATFHASPAPSALPIPSFLSKSSCDSPSNRNAQAIVQEPSPPATDTDAPTPFRPSSSVPRNHESPLDFMFRAHREEKERQYRGVVPIGQNFHSPRATSPSRPAFDSNASPNPSTVSQAHRTFSKQMSGGLGSAERDGIPGRAMGPAFSTPYQERIKAARSNSSRPNAYQSEPEQSQHEFTSSDDPAEALKRFLFSGGGSPSRPFPAGAPPGPAPATTQASAMAQPRPTNDSNVQEMENDLRRILKLDLTSNSPSRDHGFFSR